MIVTVRPGGGRTMITVSMEGGTTIAEGEVVVETKPISAEVPVVLLIITASKMADMRHKTTNNIATKNSVIEEATGRSTKKVTITSIVKSVNTSRKSPLKVAETINNRNDRIMRRKIRKSQILRMMAVEKEGINIEIAAVEVVAVTMLPKTSSKSSNRSIRTRATRRSNKSWKTLPRS